VPLRAPKPVRGNDELAHLMMPQNRARSHVLNSADADYARAPAMAFKNHLLPSIVRSFLRMRPPLRNSRLQGSHSRQGKTSIVEADGSRAKK
jgi:hypothetical protein